MHRLLSTGKLLIAVQNLCTAVYVLTSIPTALNAIADMCWRVEPGKYPDGGPRSEEKPCEHARSLIRQSDPLTQAMEGLDSDYTEELFLSQLFQKVQCLVFFFGSSSQLILIVVRRSELQGTIKKKI